MLVSLKYFKKDSNIPIKKQRVHIYILPPLLGKRSHFVQKRGVEDITISDAGTGVAPDTDYEIISADVQDGAPPSMAVVLKDQKLPADSKVLTKLVAEEDIFDDVVDGHEKSNCIRIRWAKVIIVLSSHNSHFC